MEGVQMSDTPRTDAVSRINEYLCVGGFFNPEIVNVQQHEAVRDTLIQARDELNAANDRIKRLEEAGNEMHRYITVTRGLLPECTNDWRKAKEAKP
jgi:BMFP domain-containing protein YqiC